MSMITASTWVPRGAAAQFPTKYDVDEKELSRISRLAKLQLEDAEEDLEEARNRGAEGERSMSEEEDGDVNMTSAKGDADDDLKEYDLDHYDSDHSATADANGSGESMSMFGNARSLAYHDSNAEDPYITIPDNEDEDDEREELQVLSTDNMLVAAKVEDEVAHLEIYVYEDEADNLYVHHDIMLPAIPLCVEWLDLPVGKGLTDTNAKGNFVAVGTMDPDIELWDLDTIDSMYPNAILGQASAEQEPEQNTDGSNNQKKEKKRKKSKKANDHYHTDAIISLAANRSHRNLLASASADRTIKLWDLTTQSCAKSYNNTHTDKICSIAWSPLHPTVLLSGSYDRTVCAADMRAADPSQPPRWTVESDVESVTWDPHNPSSFYIAMEGGMVHYHDMRSTPTTTPSRPTQKPIWTLQAHSGPVSAFAPNPHIPNLLATGTSTSSSSSSSDQKIKLWHQTPPSTGPSLLASRDLDVGKVFTAQWVPDAEVGGRLLAVAGSRGVMRVWDTGSVRGVRDVFGGGGVNGGGEGGKGGERVVGVEEDSEDGEEEEGGVEPSGEEKGEGEGGGGWESMEEE
ncbi:MAG: hypothetical protein LQ350_002529 [Teloschistes chrysophthalmus]|nr:MAG: hypothetical protein LQ350_002529 [Niorma chrysophthalma]